LSDLVTKLTVQDIQKNKESSADIPIDSALGDDTLAAFNKRERSKGDKRQRT
jgi:lysozyme family protein